MGASVLWPRCCYAAGIAGRWHGHLHGHVLLRRDDVLARVQAPVGDDRDRTDLPRAESQIPDFRTTSPSSA